MFAALALVLASIGIHGVLSYSVAQRTREIGIRMALGADRRRVTQLVVGLGAKLTVIGLAGGLVLGGLFSRWLASLLFGVSPGDPGTLASVLGVLGSVAALSIWIPTRRATRVNPLDALRQE
jgi:putative ABC transport system permease protein